MHIYNNPFENAQTSSLQRHRRIRVDPKLLSQVPCEMVKLTLSNFHIFLCTLALIVLGQENVGKKIQGVILTTSKDTRAFEKSIVSSLKHLVDVDTFYIVTPSAIQLQEKVGKDLGPRVKFIDESIFPFDWRNISDVMIETVREKGVYPLTGKSQFEGTVWGRVGWFLQQLLKFYAGRVLGLGDYVLLDSDIVWFKDTRFINETVVHNGVNTTRFYYASSSQYHAPYMATLKRISGMDLFKSPDTHRSGIAHHMVLAKHVLEDLMLTSEQRYGGLPFWKILLNERCVKCMNRSSSFFSYIENNMHVFLFIFYMFYVYFV